MRLIAVAAFALVLAGCGAKTGFTVENPVFQPPLGANTVGVGYFSIRSAKADRIVKVSSPAAKAVEIHDMKMTGDMMSMERRDTVNLPAGKTIEFKPGGLHLMVFSPVVAAGARADIPITIELESGLKRTVPFLESKTAGSRRN
jgi:copper(I)-binding protein